MKKSKGQSLIEVLIAFSVSITIIAAAVLAVLFALSNAQASKNQNLATQYAQEAIEIIRQNNLSGVAISGGVQCLDARMHLSNIPAGTNVCQIMSYNTTPPMSNTIPFLRQVTVETGNGVASCGSAKQVKVDVFWSDNKCQGTGASSYCEKVELVSCFNPSQVSGP